MLINSELHAHFPFDILTLIAWRIYAYSCENLKTESERRKECTKKTEKIFSAHLEASEAVEIKVEIR